MKSTSFSILDTAAFFISLQIWRLSRAWKWRLDCWSSLEVDASPAKELPGLHQQSSATKELRTDHLQVANTCFSLLIIYQLLASYPGRDKQMFRFVDSSACIGFGILISFLISSPLPLSFCLTYASYKFFHPSHDVLDFSYSYSPSHYVLVFLFNLYVKLAYLGFSEVQGA